MYTSNISNFSHLSLGGKLPNYREISKVVIEKGISNYIPLILIHKKTFSGTRHLIVQHSFCRFEKRAIQSSNACQSQYLQVSHFLRIQ